jgi:hypothetical protein
MAPEREVSIAGTDACGLPQFAIFAIWVNAALAAWSLLRSPLARLLS